MYFFIGFNIFPVNTARYLFGGKSFKFNSFLLFRFELQKLCGAMAQFPKRWTTRMVQSDYQNTWFQAGIWNAIGFNVLWSITSEFNYWFYELFLILNKQKLNE